MSVIDANDLSLFMLTTILLFFPSSSLKNRYSIMDDGCKSVLNCNEKKSNVVVEKGLPTLKKEEARLCDKCVMRGSREITCLKLTSYRGEII